MTLLDAFRRVGPIVGVSPAEDEERREAAQLLLGALRQQSRPLWKEARGRNDLLEDAIQTVLARLIRVGPRGERANDPTDDRGVERWLRKALLRRLIDEVRSRARESEAPAPAPPRADRPDVVAEGRIALENALQMASEVLQTHVMPPVGSGVGETLAELMTIAQGGTRFEDVVDAERERGGGTRGQARQRLYTRYSRALRAVAGQVAVSRAAGHIGEEQGMLVLGILDVLRLRDGS